MFGWVLNLVSALIRKESEGGLITFIFSLLALGYGITERVGGDALLATMTMGVIVVNFNIKQDRIFRILERYTEELIFVLFFTISAMHLDISVLAANYLLIVIFVFVRALGKYAGTQTGARLSKSTVKVRKFTTGGLIPQGGIVIGLALVIRQKPAFNALSDIALNVIIGATIVHEIIGPVIAKYALTRAGEISKSDKK